MADYQLLRTRIAGYYTADSRVKKATANYNMSFNNGHFEKGKSYDFRADPHDSTGVLVTTEEGTEQDLWYTEFDVLFTLLAD